MAAGGGARSGRLSLRRHERSNGRSQIARVGFSAPLVLLIAAFAALVLASFLSHTMTSAASEAEAEPTLIEVIAEHGVGDGHPATEVPIGGVADIALDAAGNVYFVDAVHSRVRRINLDGIVETVFNGHRMADLTGQQSSPCAVAVNERDGTLYVADDVANRVWVVRDAEPEVFAGTGAFGLYGDGGPATEAEFRWPRDLAVGADGTVYVADRGNHRIRAVGPDGTISTAAGDLPPDADWEDADAEKESLFLPELLAVGTDESLYVVDRFGRRLHRISRDGWASEISTVGVPSSITVTSRGTLLSADGGQVFELSDGEWVRVGSGSSVTIVGQTGDDILAYDWRRHGIYRLRDGSVPELVAGNGTAGRFGDGGPAHGATFSCYDIAVGMQGELVFSDPLNERIAVIRDDKIGTLVQAPERPQEAGDTVPLEAPRGIATDSQGRLYVADVLGHRVFRVQPDGTVETVAGNGVAGFSGDGGEATAASLFSPMDVAIAGNGDILISDSQNQRVRRVDGHGVISTVAVFDQPTGSLVLHPGGRLIVSMRAGLELATIDASGEPVEVRLVAEADRASTGGSGRDALAFTQGGDLLFMSGGRLLAIKNGESMAVPLFDSPLPLLTAATRIAVGPDGDVVFCDARQRILRLRAAALDEALAALSPR